MKVQFRKLRRDVKTPVYQTEGSAAFDLHAYVDVSGVYCICAGKSCTIRTGLHFEIPQGYFGLVAVRSGLGKRGVVLSNGVGIIDSDYRGELQVMLTNHSGEDFYIEKDERIAQLLVLPVVQVELVEVDELSETARGEGGFGSTGK